jgi:hypothetical protein
MPTPDHDDLTRGHSSHGSPGLLAVSFAEDIPWKGVVRIMVTRSGHSGVLTVIENTITDDGRDLLAQALQDGAAVPEITYLAVGDDNTAPTVSDTSLGNETFRKTITASAPGAGVGEAINTCYLAPFDANAQIEELGWFAGAATAAPDSGTMIARVLYSKDKDNLEAIQVERTDTVG